MKNGYGKIKEYYNNGQLKFESEYLNGKIMGKRKEYYENGKLKFEGEYLNGKRNGKGKEYNDKGNLLFEGEYFNDNRLNGKEYEYEYFEREEYCGGTGDYYTVSIPYIKY